MTKTIVEMTQEERDEYMRQLLTEKYSECGSKFRLVFEIASVTVMTKPMSVEELVEVYHGYPETTRYTKFLDAMDMIQGDYEFPEIQYEYIEGKVWRNFGQEYPNED